MIQATGRWCRQAACFVCCFLLSCLLLGCGSADISEQASSTSESREASGEHEHEHGHGEHAHDKADADEAHAHPADFSSAISGLEKLTAAIRSAFEKETPEEAHEELHEIGHLLESIPELAVKQKSSEPIDIEVVKEHVESLFDAFTTLDDTLHGGEAVKFSEVDQKISMNLQALKELTR